MSSVFESCREAVMYDDEIEQEMSEVINALSQDAAIAYFSGDPERAQQIYKEIEKLLLKRGIPLRNSREDLNTGE
jgi:hypothetical protein